MKKFKRIYIEITNKCNFSCSFCPTSKREKRIMTVDEFRIVIDKVKQHVEQVYLHIKGEPLTHPNLKEILQVCEDANLVVNITTNGSLLEKQKDILVSSKSLRQINVSVHSIEQNELNNITEEEYVDKVITACKYIQSNSECIIAYRLWNLDQITNTHKDMILLNKIKEKYHKDNLLDEIKTNFAIRLAEKTFLNLDTIFEWPTMEREIISKCGTCYGLITQIGVLVDGTVVPCCLDQEGVINLGNIYRQDFNKIIESERVEDKISGFKTSKLVEPLCQRCGFRKNKRR